MTDVTRVTRNETPAAKTVTSFHKNADTDGSVKALHHTIGPGPMQAAAGNHTHDGGQSAFIDPANVTPADVPWIALPYSGGWTDYATGFILGGYRKVNDVVEFRGMMKHATVTTTGAFATMPIGYRPSGSLQWWCPGSGGGNVDVRISNTGVISVASYGANASGASVSLNSIRYSTL